MDKNIIKQHLNKTFLSEASKSDTPGIQVTAQMHKESGKENKAGVKKIADDLKTYEKSLTKPDPNVENMAQNKFNYTGDEEKEYHEEMEIMNGQEMVQYDREPDADYKKRALEAIEGSARMGNSPEWANIVAKGQGGDPEFGKNLVKKIKASAKKRSEQTPTSKMFGDDWEIVKDKSHKPYAVEGEEKKKPALNEGILADNNYTHFAVNKQTGKLLEAWNYKGIYREELIAEKNSYFYNDLADLDLPLKKGDIKIVTKGTLAKEGINPQDINNWDDLKKPKSQPEVKPESQAQAAPSLEEKQNKNKPQIKEAMKRLKFKKEFNGVGNALKVIPETYKVDKKVFEITDGNETYKIRWEGPINEGKAVVITAANKTMVNEDIQRMKQLFNYKPESTLGTIKGKDRIEENKSFADIWAKAKKILSEEEDIEDVTAPEEDTAGDSGITQAPEAKKDIEGSASTDDGTNVPAPKTGEWDKIAITQAPEAKKHVEGTASTDKGTKAPAPKVGEWDKTVKKAAPEATKDVKKK